MKIGICLLALFCSFTAAAQTLAPTASTDWTCDRQFKGHDGPYPWGTEVQFPWDEVRGIWQGDFGPYVFYFHLQVVTKNPDGLKYLYIRELGFNSSLEDWSVMASGAGYEYCDSHVIYAMVVGSGVEHYIVLRAYENPITRKKDVVITIPNLPKIGQKEPNAVLKRVF